MRTLQKPIYPTIDIDALNTLSLNASSVIKQARSSMLAPEARKSPPYSTPRNWVNFAGWSVPK